MLAPKYRRQVIYGRVKVEVWNKEYGQLTMKELLDPFMGEPVTKDKK